MSLTPTTIVCPVYAPQREATTAAPATAKAGRFQRSATYEGARTGPLNREHWAHADDYSANAAADPETRRILRRRARYERDNDPHLNGLTKTLAYDLVGTGPRLQFQLGEEHEDAARLVEQSFAAWCRAADIADKLRVMHEARPTDGESFGLLTHNPLLANPVKLDLKVLEADQIASPLALDPTDPNAIDGIEFDQYGNPAFYHVLKQHPGDSGWWNWAGEADKVQARYVLHWFRPARPGQARGVSELASSLPIGSQTRRYSAAVLGAAEFAASIAGVMHSTLPPADGGPVAVEAMDEIPVSRMNLLTLPEGWAASQFKAEQPTGTYKEYVGEKRNEMARPMLAPFNVISGNSSGYNYSSGRLDHVPYHRVVWIERERFRQRVIDKLFLAWVQEAQLVGLIPDTLPPLNLWLWEWHWDGFNSIDPFKDAQAVQMRLATGLSTLSEECAAEGKDWKDVMTQRAREIAFAEELGLAPTGTPAPEPEPAPAEEPADA
jgi:lambda family phage portal protein